MSDQQNPKSPIAKPEVEVVKPKLLLDEVTGDMVSKNELKKRNKMRKAAEKKKAKEEAKRAKEAAEEEKKGDQPKEEGLAIGGDDELEPNKYTENRKNWL